MKFAVVKEHKNYFLNHGFIQLQGLMKADAAAKHCHSVDAALIQRMSVKASMLPQLDAETLFFAGRDLWRDYPLLESLFRQRNFSELASEFFSARLIRLAFTQDFPAGRGIIGKAYSELIENKLTLSEYSCIQGIFGGLILCLESASEGEAFLPKVAGDGLFINATTPLDLSSLAIPTSGRYQLIVYTAASSVYTHLSSDTHQNFLKDLGYNFGDKLLDKLHPILYR